MFFSRVVLRLGCSVPLELGSAKKGPARAEVKRDTQGDVGEIPASDCGQEQTLVQGQGWEVQPSARGTRATSWFLLTYRETASHIGELMNSKFGLRSLWKMWMVKPPRNQLYGVRGVVGGGWVENKYPLLADSLILHGWYLLLVE